jgi:hypothetical protein
MVHIHDRCVDDGRMCGNGGTNLSLVMGGRSHAGFDDAEGDGCVSY